MIEKTIKLKPEFVGTAFYEKLEKGPNQVFGERGSYQRHLVVNEGHLKFSVITPASSDVIPEDAEVEIINPVFYPDYINGRNMNPYLNVFADKLVVKK